MVMRNLQRDAEGITQSPCEGKPLLPLRSLYRKGSETCSWTFKQICRCLATLRGRRDSDHALEWKTHATVLRKEREIRADPP